MKKQPPVELAHLGSLITIRGTDQCLGYLMYFDGRGTFDPTLGLVHVTKEQADIHNKLLSQALLEGLDTRCEVGQGGTFYLGKTDGVDAVRTWTGETVTTDVTVRGKRITFRRHGREYYGVLQKDAECFNFRRVK